MRDIILRLLLGDRLIHIRYLPNEYLDRPLRSKLYDKTKAPGRLCSAFCVAEKSEQEAYDEANHSSGKAEATKDPNDIATCKDRHKDCLMCNYGPLIFSSENFHAQRLTFDKNLSVLAVSRQLYEESNNILWQTNIFSFDHPESFTRFNRGMNTAQKHKLKKIHLCVDLPIDEMSIVGYRANWAAAIAQRVLRPLKNLKVVHLSIEQYCMWELMPFERSSQCHVNENMDILLGLRLLPWKKKEGMTQGKHVTVIISDKKASRSSGSITPHWTRTQKLEAAEKLRAQLAAPDSAEIHIAEMKAREDAHKKGE